MHKPSKGHTTSTCFSSAIICSDFKATGKEYSEKKSEKNYSEKKVFLKKKIKLGFQLKETVKIGELHKYVCVSH